MPFSIPHLGLLPAFWAVAVGVSAAPETPRLRVQPERLRTVRVAEQQALAANDSLALAEAYYQYGRTYVFAGDYRASQGYFLKSLRIMEPKGDSFELTRLYVRLSENEGRLGRSADAMRYARQSLSVARRVRAPKALGLAYGVLARMHEHSWESRPQQRASQGDSALMYYGREKAIYEALNDTAGVAEANLELGTLYTKLHDPRAIPYLRKALRLITPLRKDRVRVNFMLHLSTAYLTFGRPKLAFQTLREARRLYVANRVDEYDTVLGLEGAFVRYYQTTGDWKQAFAHAETRNRLVQNHLLSDRDAAIARLNVEYETDKKQALLNRQQNELALRTENLRVQQRFTAATSVLLLLTAGMSLVFFRLFRKNQRISRWNADLVKEQNHRVKNNLQVVSSLLNMQAKRLTDEAAKRAVNESRLRVESMAVLHRRLYDGDRLARVDLSTFIPEVVSGVLTAYGCETIRPQFSIDAISLSADKAVPLGLILNELTTNACKYAFPTADRPEYVIRCRRQKQAIVLSVTDNGTGLEGPGWTDTRLDGLEWAGGRGNGSATAQPATKKSSFGMQLIRAQVTQLRGTSRFDTGWADGRRGSRFTMTFNGEQPNL